MDDQRNPETKVVVIHEPRCSRVIGYRDSVADGADFELETPMPDPSELGNLGRGNPQEIALVDVQVVDGELELEIDDSVFEDTQYEDACMEVA